LKYKVIDFDENLAWFNPEKTLVSQSFKIEGSLLLPLGGGLSVQIGYGYTFDSIRQDDISTQKNRQYAIFAVRKTE
jgi:hypothetical protein